MNDIKRAFEKLDSKQLSDSKKQRIFDSIIGEHSRRRALRKKMFTIAAPALAACVIAAAVLVLPGVIAPEKQQGDMIVIDRPQESANDAVMLTQDSPKVVSTVVLSLNPVVKFGLDENGYVVQVEGLDADGERLLDGIDFTGLSFENASIVVVNQLLLNDYINSGVSQAQITVSLDSETAGMDTLGVLTNTITTAAVQHKIDVSVTQSDEAKELSIVLTGEDESTAAAKDAGAVTVKYVQTADAGVSSVSASGDDGEELLTPDGYEGMPFRQAVLFSINDLIKQGIINDEGESEILFNIGTTDETLSAGFKYLTQLLLTQAGLSLEVLGTDEAGVFGLASSENTSGEQPQLTMSQILNPAVHKSITELTKTQAEILEFVYTQEQIEELFAVRYWVVVPNLSGLEETKAVELLEKMGIVPVVTMEYNEDYAQFEEGTVFLQGQAAGAMIEKGERLQVFVLGSNPNPLGDGWTPSVHSEPDTAQDAAASAQYETYASGTGEIYIRIMNNSEDETLLYDAGFTLERLYEGEWYSAVCPQCFEPAAKQLGPLETAAEKIDLSSFGELPDGQYRIIKQLGQNKYSARFDIAADGYDSIMLSGYIPLDGLPAEYTAQTAQQNGDLIKDDAGSTLNEGKLEAFLKDAGDGIPAKLRITGFTQEGYALIEDVVFTGRYYYVERDTSRADGQTQRDISRYSYIMLFSGAGRTGIMLADSYLRLPVNGEYTNTQGYVIVDDIGTLAGGQAEELVLGMMDEDAPLKVYSPDGKKFVSYTKGKKTVNYEVNAESQYGSGIILPDDCAEVVALEWRDNSVVLITYGQQEGGFMRIAFDVDIQNFTQVSEQENADISTADEDYFTQDDMQQMTQQFADNISRFSLLLDDGIGTVSYVIDANGAVITRTQPDTEPVVETVEWSEQDWDGFVQRILELGVLDWYMVYEGPAVSGVQWTLEIASGEQSFDSMGRGGYPSQFDGLTAIMDEYFAKNGG